MTMELQLALEKEMEDALSISDHDRRDDAVQTVQTHMLRSLVDCQRKTSERVKTVVSDIGEMKPTLSMCAESDREYRETKLKARGAKWAFGVVLSIASVGGPILAIKFCKIVGILW